MRALRLAAILACALAIFPPTVQAAEVEAVHVTMIGNEFKPGQVETAVGKLVQFEHLDGETGHSVTSGDPALAPVFESSPSCGRGLPAEKCMVQGDVYRFVFLAPGTYRYYCRIHGTPPTAGYPEWSGMTGTIVVK